jgi:hypothetical protein
MTSETPLPQNDDDDDGIRGEPWCRDFEAHKPLHEFCSDHQAMWCRKCDRGCPSCFDDPHCPGCHCSLFSEEHDWDCSYYGDDDDL